MNARLLLCIGCQKGGTSWLAEYLRARPDVRLGARKEMHAFDVHFLEANRDWHLRRIARTEARLAGLKATPWNARARASLARKLAGYRQAQSLTGDLELYVAYFRDIAAAEPAVGVVADLTPDYSLLRAEHWPIVKAALERGGFEVRVLFLLRDPVDRIDSAWRMSARDAGRAAELGAGLLRRAAARGTALARRWAALAPPAVEGESFFDFANRDLNLERSRFDETIKGVEAVFPAADIHYEFYESLFEPSALERITRFLGLTFREADFNSRVNASPMRGPASPTDVARVRALLAPTYDFCAERFGRERLEALWPHYAAQERSACAQPAAPEGGLAPIRCAGAGRICTSAIPP